MWPRAQMLYRHSRSVFGQASSKRHVTLVTHIWRYYPKYPPSYRLSGEIQLSVLVSGRSIKRTERTSSHTAAMSLFANIVGFSLVGLAARVGQLGIQKRPILESTFSSLCPLPVDD